MGAFPGKGSRPGLSSPGGKIATEIKDAIGPSVGMPAMRKDAVARPKVARVPGASRAKSMSRG